MMNPIRHLLRPIGILCREFVTESSWPFGMTEQRSRIQKKGGHCVSEASLPAAECGEQRSESGGSRQGTHGFGSFCRNKRTSAAGPRPGLKPKKYIHKLFAKYFPDLFRI